MSQSQYFTELAVLPSCYLMPLMLFWWSMYIVSHFKWSVLVPCFTTTTLFLLSYTVFECFVQKCESFSVYRLSQVRQPDVIQNTCFNGHLSTHACVTSTFQLCRRSVVRSVSVKGRKPGQTSPSLSLRCCSRSCRSTRPCRGTCGRWDSAWAPSGEAPGTLPGWTNPQTLCSGH